MFLRILMLLVIRLAFIETLVVPLTVAFIFCECNTPKNPKKPCCTKKPGKIHQNQIFSLKAPQGTSRFALKVTLLNLNTSELTEKFVKGNGWVLVISTDFTCAFLCCCSQRTVVYVTQQSTSRHVFIQNKLISGYASLVQTTARGLGVQAAPGV